MLWRHHLKIKSKIVTFEYHIEMMVRILKTETIITLVQKYFSAGKISFKKLSKFMKPVMSVKPIISQFGKTGLKNELLTSKKP